MEGGLRHLGLYGGGQILFPKFGYYNDGQLRITSGRVGVVIELILIALELANLGKGRLEHRLQIQHSDGIALTRQQYQNFQDIVLFPFADKKYSPKRQQFL